VAKVSILMNAYNAQKYLKEAIDSVYAQTFQDWEIIFIDNCSVDGTKKIVKSYDDKIKYYKTDHNIPLGAARNFGLQFCTAQYIAFLDTDDIWLNNKLNIQIGVMDKNIDYKLCYGGVIYIDKSGKEIGGLVPKASSGNVFSQQLKRYEINMQSVLLRNDSEIKISEDLRHSPDYDLFMKIASNSNIYVIKDHLVKYRKLEDSLTSKNIDVWWIEMKSTLDKIFSQNHELKKVYPREHKMAYAKVAYYKAQYLLSKDNKEDAKKELSKYKFVHINYLMLYVISFFPKQVWNFIHRKY